LLFTTAGYVFISGAVTRNFSGANLHKRVRQKNQVIMIETPILVRAVTYSVDTLNLCRFGIALDRNK